MKIKFGLFWRTMLLNGLYAEKVLIVFLKPSCPAVDLEVEKKKNEEYTSVSYLFVFCAVVPLL